MREKKLITLTFPIIFLAIALFINGLPYGFYTLLRFVICISALYHVWLIKEENKFTLSAFFILIAILFNPIIPIELTREIWIYIDSVVLLFFLVQILLYFSAFFTFIKKIKVTGTTLSLFIVLICLVMVLIFRWDVSWDDKFSYHHDMLTSITFIKLNGEIVGKARLPQNAILISNAITGALYLLIGVTIVGLLRGIIKK